MKREKAAAGCRVAMAEVEERRKWEILLGLGLVVTIWPNSIIEPLVISGCYGPKDRLSHLRDVGPRPSEPFRAQFDCV